MLTMSLMITSCHKTDSFKQKEKQKSVEICYVLDDNLSSDFYSTLSSIELKEGIVSSPEVAVGIAQAVWTGIYGKDIVEKEKPFSVNLENEIWIVEGAPPKGEEGTIIFGGNLYIEIKKSTGEVIKVFRVK